MTIKPAQCPNCGAKIMVDTDSEAGLCEKCNNPFLVEDAISELKAFNKDTTIDNEANDIIDLPQDYSNKDLEGKEYIKLPNTVKNSLKGEFQDWCVTKKKLMLMGLLFTSLISCIMFLLGVTGQMVVAWVFFGLFVAGFIAMVYLYVLNASKNMSNEYMNWLKKHKKLIVDN